MTRTLSIHPDNPQPRLLRAAADCLLEGGVLATPTDACHALVWRVGDRDALERVRRIRALDARHLMTLICRDLAQMSVYAAMDTQQFRFVKEWTPGPYTFVLPATREVPKRLLHPSRRTLGARLPQSPIVRGLLEALGEPLLGTTLQLPGDDQPLSEADEIEARLDGRIELIIEGGHSGLEPTTLIDLTGEAPLVVRIGCGPVEAMLGKRR
jgi:tRNA threonylcarbamoyl adenosine modification protein (Sua5/YciO/YrdC/YwlC family)